MTENEKEKFWRPGGSQFECWATPDEYQETIQAVLMEIFSKGPILEQFGIALAQSLSKTITEKLYDRFG
jgi:hypothetical protein